METNAIVEILCYTCNNNSCANETSYDSVVLTKDAKIIRGLPIHDDQCKAEQN